LATLINMKNEDGEFDANSGDLKMVPQLEPSPGRAWLSGPA
jgi:hypothetical protein